jgi:hypothetical protein
MRRYSGTEADLRVVLRTGPFHAALRAAIHARGITLDRLRVHLARRGVSIGLSTLSNWQHGHSRPAPASLPAMRTLEDVLGLAPSALTGLLPMDDHLGEDDSPLGVLLDVVPRSRESGLDVLNQHDKVTLDEHGHDSHAWTRMTVRANRDGVDRYWLRYFGDSGGTVGQVSLRGLENCRLGQVVRHPSTPVLIAELEFGQTLRAGETWVFEHQLVDDSGEVCTEYAHAFRQPGTQYLLEVRFHPDRPPVRCHSFAQFGLNDRKRRTDSLRLNAHHAVHLVAPEATTGVVGIGWDFP